MGTANIGLSFGIPPLTAGSFAGPSDGKDSLHRFRGSRATNQTGSLPLAGPILLFVTFGENRKQDTLRDGYFIEFAQLDLGRDYYNETGTDYRHLSLRASGVNFGYTLQSPNLVSETMFAEYWPPELESLELIGILAGAGLGVWHTRLEDNDLNGGVDQYSNYPLAFRLFLQITAVSINLGELAKYGELGAHVTFGAMAQVSLFDYLGNGNPRSLQPLGTGSITAGLSYQLEL